MEVKKVKREDISKVGEAIYKEKILPTLGPEDDGKLVAIDVTTGNYEIDGRVIELSDKLLDRNPDALNWLRRAGPRPEVHSIGGGSGLPINFRRLS